MPNLAKDRTGNQRRYGTKTDQGVTYTLAVVGTNVDPYLVAALGASTQSPDQAESYALKVFSALSAQMS